MNRHDKENLCRLVDGYYSETPSESKQVRFDKAKMELIESFTRQINLLSELTLNDFILERNRGKF